MRPGVTVRGPQMRGILTSDDHWEGELLDFYVDPTHGPTAIVLYADGQPLLLLPVHSLRVVLGAQRT